MLRWLLLRRFYVFVALLAVGPVRSTLAAENVCANGATTPAAYCNYFVYFNKENDPVSAISSAIDLGDGDQTRSIALVMGVDTYKKKELNLEPAKEDVAHLQDFLIDDQKFDEVIVLRNEDVNIVNINYFFNAYLIKLSERYSKIRILVAYSGHGMPGNAKGSKGYLVLPGYSDDKDLQNLLSLGIFKQYLSELGPQSFQIMLLVNACYGGDLFAGSSAGGNDFDSTETTAWAVTAGSPDDLVYSLGQPGQGSIFFDSIIKAVKSGTEEYFDNISGPNGQEMRLGKGIAFITDVFKSVTRDVKAINHAGEKQYPLPWQGSIEPIPVVSKGGFFLLSRQRGIVPASLKPPLIGKSGPVSSISGHPEIKVFNRPDEYKVRGIDVSQYNDQIDWKDVSKNNEEAKLTPQFAYIRASMGADRHDKNFEANWSGAKTAALDRGAYHVLDFCEPGDAQASNIQKSIPIDPNALPLAIDVELGEFKGAPHTGYSLKQQRCLSEQGEDSERNKLRQILQSVEKYYGKRPIIFGDSAVFATFIDDSFKSYPIWLHQYNERTGGASLAGGNPWTLWQYTNLGRIAGSNKPVDQSAFFGPRDRYNQFKQSGFNYALAAATGEVLK